MKFIFLILIIISLNEKLLCSKLKRKKEVQLLLEQLDHFINQTTNSSNPNFELKSPNISSKLLIPQNTYAHSPEKEFFINYSKINISTYTIDNSKNLNDLNTKINMSLEILKQDFEDLGKKIKIPSANPREFLKNIYPEFYIKTILFFEFCNKTLSFGLLDLKLHFKEVLLQLK